MTMALAAARIRHSSVRNHQATATPRPEPGGVSVVTMDWHRGLDTTGKRHPETSFPSRADGGPASGPDILSASPLQSTV